MVRYVCSKIQGTNKYGRNYAKIIYMTKKFHNTLFENKKLISCIGVSKDEMFTTGYLFYLTDVAYHFPRHFMWRQAVPQSSLF